MSSPVSAALSDLNGSGTSSDPYQITDWNELDLIRNDLSAYYELQNDLTPDTAGYDQVASSNANGGSGWNKIATDNAFTGFIYGQHYKIDSIYSDSNLIAIFNGTINNVAFENIILEGEFCSLIEIMQAGSVSGVRIEGEYINDSGETGGITSRHGGGTIQHCFTNINIQENSNNRAGGIVGYARSDLSGLEGTQRLKNCYSLSDVSGNGKVGGLLGGNQSDSLEAYDCYVAGTLEGDVVGGFVEYENGGTYTDCYWDTEVTGVTSSGGGTGLTTSEMQGSTSMALSSHWDEITSASYEQDGYPINTHLSENKQLLAQGFYIDIEVQTTGSSNIGTNSVTVSGDVSTLNNVDQGDVWFEYGIGDFSNQTDTQTVSSTVEVTAEITGLETGTEYQFRIAGKTPEGNDSDQGGTLTFTTLSPDIAVSTIGSQNVTETGATLVGEVTELKNTDSGTVYFEWGQGDFTNTTSKQTVQELTEITADVNLNPGTEYTFRIVGETSDASDQGSSQTFTTDLSTSDGSMTTNTSDDTNQTGGIPASSPGILDRILNFFRSIIPFY